MMGKFFVIAVSTIVLCMACGSLRSSTASNTTSVFHLDLFNSENDVQNFNFLGLQGTDRDAAWREINSKIATYVSARNPLLGQKAQDNIYSDWWCYEDKVLFEARLAMQISQGVENQTLFDEVRTQLRELMEQVRHDLPPAPKQPKSFAEQETKTFLREMIERDQFWNAVVMESFQAMKTKLAGNKDAVEALRQLVAKEQCDIYAQNAAGIELLLSEIGWPEPAVYGKEFSRYLRIMVLHLDYHLDLQEFAVVKFKDLLDQGKVSEKAYAYLYDRYGLNTRGKQRYGTQVQCTPTGYAPQPLEDPDNFEEIRANAGFMPFEQYKNMVPGCTPTQSQN